jgi:hypothetical protein
MEIIIWYVENVIGNEWCEMCRGLTHLCPSPPLFNNFPKVYTKPRKNARNHGVEIDTGVEIDIKKVEIDTKKIEKIFGKT